MSHSQTKSRAARWLRAGLAGLCLLATGGALSTGCLDRPVAPAQPRTSNIFVDKITQTAIDKIDLLFVIDNSISMADKQRILEAAVPELVNRLISPRVVDGVQEFTPVDDIHIGIVSSSLGGHGADWCSPQGPEFNPTQDDRGHLIGERGLRPGATFTTYNDLGFLAWDPDGEKVPPGEANAGNLVANFRNMVVSTGELGCGYEATLEAWYRFLIDPNPPLTIRNDGSNAIPEGLDEPLLAQRRAFLRPDSLVAIIMLTDENDCSIIDGGQAWYATQSGLHLPLATSTCDQNPNSPCCRNCGDNSPPPDGCGPVGSDPRCANDERHNEETNPQNLRCWDQKKRFGVDFLYPTSRYVEGLKSAQVRDWRTGTDMPNPLYLDLTGGTAISRDPGLVFLAGIVGVPWQDIATQETLNDPDRLEYRRFENIDWNLILGDVNANQPPTDALMREDRAPRDGANPITGAALQPPSAGPMANPINGHEYTTNTDLQYACIFDLVPDRDCATEQGACDCRSNTDVAANKPLCQNPATGAYGNTQFFAKAYPGLRHLQVLKDFGANSIVASICPKVIGGDTTSPSYGYNPAVAAIIDRLKEVLGVKCLPRPLSPDTETTLPDGVTPNPDFGKVPCQVVEASPPLPAGGCGACGPGRTDLASDDPLIPAVQRRLRQLEQCGPDSATETPCDQFCMCRLEQLVGGACQTEAVISDTNLFGYCYVDETVNADLVSNCKPTERRLLRFVGEDVPAPGSIAFIACQDDSQLE